MADEGRYLNVVLFIGLYLLVSIVPYLALNWAVVVAVVARYYPPDPVGLAIWLFGSALLVLGFTLAAPGVDRYIQLLFWPADVLSAAVDASYVWAGASWWALPWLARTLAVDVTWDVYLAGVFLSHVPPVLFLTLMAVVARTRAADDAR